MRARCSQPLPPRPSAHTRPTRYEDNKVTRGSLLNKCSKCNQIIWTGNDNAFEDKWCTQADFPKASCLLPGVSYEQISSRFPRADDPLIVTMLGCIREYDYEGFQEAPIEWEIGFKSFLPSCPQYFLIQDKANSPCQKCEIVLWDAKNCLVRKAAGSSARFNGQMHRFYAVRNTLLPHWAKKAYYHHISPPVARFMDAHPWSHGPVRAVLSACLGAGEMVLGLVHLATWFGLKVGMLAGPAVH